MKPDMTPKLSIATTVKNGARYLQETIGSITKQTFTDYEHVVVDGGSTDETRAILKKYGHIRLFCEADNNVVDGQRKAIALTRGRYLMFCCVSDGYLDPSWFQQCVGILDSNPDVSLVYGLHKVKRTDDTLTPVIYDELETMPPPQKMDFLPFWLATFFPFQESTWCVRTEIFKAMLPSPNDKSYCGRWSPFMKFRFNFNRWGYLPYFLPLVACYTREHTDSLNNGGYRNKKSQWIEEEHMNNIVDYRCDVLSGRKTHAFRDGEGRIIEKIGRPQLPDLNKKVLEYRTSRKSHFPHIDPLNKKFLMSKYGRRLSNTDREHL